ncbi:NADH-quinone oxidoreductase subunit J family protein [Hymenobacter chitinivorans]|uniref:NADH-quinone oxidoreductase subunit J n=1 Tax=Hymenobacter chitinivorans DSM 11115 TaxID=1121954 RepID=A0A2M9APX1_9BACT|nr:NADH-quinone oxidoreductase subunit J [Hymenobacter chitinivorans]PJJ47741.1 NADH-quinone oxidoreductase subunit J [Hymenobacter chitinivorans DSM 11115]
MASSPSLFFFLSFVALFAALGVVLAKNPVHSVLFLILTFFSLSGHYLILNAQFLAAVNIIVYAGAIMVLFLFVIMFLNLNADTEPHKSTLSKVAAAVAGGLLLVVMVAALRDVQTGTTFTAATFNSQIGMVSQLGMILYTKYLLPFELASVLFLAAMVGAVMLGKREAGERNF